MGGLPSELRTKTKKELIKVDCEYEVLNGLFGMKRDIILRLCELMLVKDKNIRAVFGMCREHFVWRTCSYFVRGRPQGVSFRPNSLGKFSGVKITGKPPLNVAFTSEFGDRTVVLSHALTVPGVFRWTIKIAYAKKGWSSFAIGTIPPSRINKYDGSGLGDVTGRSCFNFRKSPYDLHSHIGGLHYCTGKSLMKVPDGSMVAIELDGGEGTLSFFVNEEKVPHAVSELCLPLHFGVSGHNSSFTSVLFRRQKTPTPSDVVCTWYQSEWRKDFQFVY